MKRRSVVAAIVVLVLAMIASPTTGAGAESSTPASSGGGKLQLLVGLAEDVDGMNPFSSWSGPTWEAFRLNYNFLTWYDDDFNVKPELARSWDHSPDGKLWTFHIRDDVMWQDGEPLTARDIAFTYNLILDNDLAAYTGYLPFVTSVTATDDKTLVIENSRPSSGMLALYIPILPEHVWSNVPVDKLDSWKNIPTVGSGPFQVVESKKGEHVKLVANKQYFEGAPTLDEVWFTIYQDPDACIQEFKAGRLDAVSLTGANYLRSLQGTPGAVADAYPSIGFHELGFNCWRSPKSKGDPSLLDARVRQAIHWAIDKQKLVDVAMGGLARPGTSVVSPLVPWHWEPPADQLVTYDPEKARSLLDEAGYKDVNDDGLRETPAGKPWSLRLTPLTDYPEDVSAAKMITTWMKDVGIDNELDPMEEGAFSDANWEGDFDLYFWSWGGDIDPGFILSVFTTEQIHSWSDCFYSNPAYDKLYRDQAAAFDPEQRRQVIDKAQQLLYRESPYIVLWYYVDTTAFRTDTWSGWTQAPTGQGSVLRNFSRTSYLKLRPTAAGAARQRPPWGLYGIVALAVVVVVGVAFVLRGRESRRRLEE